MYDWCLIEIYGESVRACLRCNAHACDFFTGGGMFGLQVCGMRLCYGLASHCISFCPRCDVTVGGSPVVFFFLRWDELLP